jgi:O-antigen/teichoic acid export membrane protein
MAPAFLVMLVVAPDLLPTVFGPKWDDAIPVLQLLCLAGVAYSLNTVNGLLLLVTDNAGGLFRLSVMVTVTVTVAVAIGLEWGIVGVAAAYALAHWLLVVPELWITTRRASFPLAPALRVACSPLPFAFAAAGLAWLVRHGLEELGAAPVVRIIVATAVLLAAYAGLAYIGSKPLRREMRAGLARLRRLRMVRRSMRDAARREVGEPEL